MQQNVGLSDWRHICFESIFREIEDSCSIDNFFLFFVKTITLFIGGFRARGQSPAKNKETFILSKVSRLLKAS